MIAVHRSLKSEGVIAKLLTALAVSQSSRADHKTGITNFHLQSVLLLPVISFNEIAFGRLPDDRNCFWPTPQWAPQSNDPAAGSLHHCHATAQQIGTIPWLRSSGDVRNGLREQGLRARRPAHGTDLVIFTMTPRWQKRRRQRYHFWLVSVFKQFLLLKGRHQQW